MNQKEQEANPIHSPQDFMQHVAAYYIQKRLFREYMRRLSLNNVIKSRIILNRLVVEMRQFASIYDGGLEGMDEYLKRHDPYHSRPLSGRYPLEPDLKRKIEKTNIINSV